MTFFSRLTDIVTCNLTALLEQQEQPADALLQIIAEMEEGLAGAHRSVSTAEASKKRIQQELDEAKTQIEYWNMRARTELAAGREDQARLALIRKQEANDLVVGLEQQHHAASATHEHMVTMLNALKARIAEARRRLQEFSQEASDKTEDSGEVVGVQIDRQREQQIEEELAALKREIGR